MYKPLESGLYYYMEKGVLQKPLLDFYHDLRQITIDENVVTLNPGVVSETIARLGKEDSRPLLVLCPPTINSEHFLATARKLAEKIKAHFPEQAEAIDQIIASLPEESARRTELVAKVFVPGANLADYFSQELPEEVLELLFEHTAQLYMKQYVKIVLPTIDLEHWHKGVCPICGRKPNLAILEKDGKGKYLHCGHCEIKWRFQRLSCPYCSSCEAKYLLIEGIKKYRVYICDECGGYIKTINCEHTIQKNLDLLLEDIDTIQLDLLALSKGYHK